VADDDDTVFVHHDAVGSLNLCIDLL
jgi:hypothetical protein